jgi:2-keto-4-pentenoate hydratase
MRPIRDGGSMNFIRLLSIGLAIVLYAAQANAACPSPDQIDRFVKDWKAKAPTAAMAAGASLDDAMCAQGLLVERLKPELGKIVGYKAGLTSKALQERFGVSEPVRGQLLAGMLLQDGAAVPASFGARPLYEADLLLVVKDEDINSANTPEEALRHISAVRPFIELPDLAVKEGEPMNGVVLAAANVAARYGVMGAEIPMNPTPEMAKALADMTVVVTDGSGAKLAEGKGNAVLGSPLNVAIWIARDLAASGTRLKAGDLISVGSFTPLTPPKPGQTVTARYDGLPGNPQVSVSFK